jgi:hypothetical protein
MDEYKESKKATVQIAIEAENDPPRPVSMNVTAAEGSANITLTATDPEGDALHFAIYSEPSFGVLLGNAPDLVYVAEPGFAGSDKFLFTASDNMTENRIGIVSVLVERFENNDAEYQEDEVESGESQPSNADTLGNRTDITESDLATSEVENADKESTTKVRADKSNVMVMVSWDHGEQDQQIESTLNLKFAEHRTRAPLASHIWYDLVMLDSNNQEILRKHDLVAMDAQDTQSVIFPTNGTYHFEVNVKGVIDKSSNAITRSSDYTGKALGIVVVPEFSSSGIVFSFAAFIFALVAARHKLMARITFGKI